MTDEHKSESSDVEESGVPECEDEDSDDHEVPRPKTLKILKSMKSQTLKPHPMCPEEP